MKSFLLDLLSVGKSKVLVIVFGLGYAIITARYLGPELNGLLASLMVYPTLFLTFGSLGIRQSVAYFIGKGHFEESLIKKAVVFLWYVSSAFCLVSSYYLIRYFSNSGENVWIIYLAILPIPFTLFNTYNSGVFLGKNEIKEFNKINWLPPFFKLIAAVLFIIIIDLSITGALSAGLVAPVIMSVLLFKRNGFLKGFSLKIDFKVVKKLLLLGIVYAIALVVINLNYKIDLILLDKLSSQYETGIYSKGSQLIEYLWEIPMLLSTIVFARSASAIDNNIFSLKVVQLLRVSIVAVGIGSTILFISSKWIITLLFGHEFEQSSTVQQLLLPGIVLLTIFKVLNMDLAGKGKPWIAMIAMVPALFINVLLNLVWIPEHGANGAAIASTISYSLAAVLFLFLYSREVSIPIRVIIGFKREDFAPITRLLNKNNI